MVSPNLPKIWALRAPYIPMMAVSVIQAGERPQLGDLNREMIPEAYQRVAQGGDVGANSSLGSQWKGCRSQSLEDYASEMKKMALEKRN